MLSDTFFGLIALLYYLCFLLLTGMTLLVACRGRRHAKKYGRLRRSFMLLATSLALWQVTLFLEVRTTVPVGQLWLARLNFAAIVAASYLAFRFVAAVPQGGSTNMTTSSWGTATIDTVGELMSARLYTSISCFARYNLRKQ